MLFAAKGEWFHMHPNPQYSYLIVVVVVVVVGVIISRCMRIWNSLPVHVVTAATFKKHLKTFLLQRSYSLAL